MLLLTKNQEKQTKIITEGQKKQLQAIEDQTNEIKALTTPTTPAIEPTERSIPAIESQSEDEYHDVDTKSLDSQYSIIYFKFI